MRVQDVLEALADPNRRKILQLLREKELSVGEIQKHFQITGASLSHHLNKLRAADLVLARRQGQNIFYAIHTSVFEDMTRYMAEFFNVGKEKSQ